MLIASTSRSITRIYPQCEIHRHSIYPHCYQLHLQPAECSWTLFRTLTARRVLRGLFPLSDRQSGDQILKGCPYMINNQQTPSSKAPSEEIRAALLLGNYLMLSTNGLNNRPPQNIIFGHSVTFI
jgi:hypothetical protein